MLSFIKIFCLWTESKKKMFTWASNLQSTTFIRNWRSIICRKKLTLQTFYITLSELISYCKTTSLKLICVGSPLNKNFMTDRQSVQLQYLQIIKKHWKLQSWNFFSKQNLSPYMYDVHHWYITVYRQHFLCKAAWEINEIRA